MEIKDIDFYVQKGNLKQANSQTEMILLFVLEGKMTIQSLDEIYPMSKEDILLINPGIHYEIMKEEEALYSVASFSLKFLSDILKSRNTMFYCNSVIDETHSFQDLKNLFYELTVEFTSRHHKSDCYMHSLLLKVLDCLVENYQVSQDPIVMKKESENDLRMREIMQYIMANIDREISLNELANQMFVSPSTLSRIFKKDTGVYFADYVMELRVKNAAELLKHSHQNITHIAMASGFTSSASFNRAFKKVLGIRPSEYRDSYKQIESEDQKQKKKEEIQIREELKQKGYDDGKIEENTQIHLDLKRNIGHKYNRPWNQMINIGPMWDLTKANIQTHILYLNEKLHYRYFRFWNVFSKRMLINDGHTKGQYNYDVVNQALDFLVQNRLKPFIAFGRRPDIAIKSDGKRIFFDEQYIMFSSKENWQAMVDDFIRNVVSRYGQDEVSQWIFELDRDFEETLDGSENRLYEDPQYNFFEAWTYLYRTIKRRIPSAKVGGISSLISKNWNFLNDFYQQCKQSEVKPDFVSFLLFPYETHKNKDLRLVRKVSQDKNCEENQIREIKRLLKQNDIADIPIYITEWNNSISNRNYLNDSCYRATYIVKKVNSIANSVDMLGIMAGTDWVSSYLDTVGILNGGIGLLTKDTICKPAYFAFDFLNQLGDYLLEKGENYIVSKKENGDIYILCFHYIWFKQRYFLSDEDVDVRDNFDLIFENAKPIHLNFHLSDFNKPGEYYVKRRCLNRKNGSILNEWEKFQYDKRMTQRDVKYLQGISFPKLSQDKVQVDNTLDIKISLEPHEVSLIHIFMR